jgi:hypothetical protein
VDQLIPLNLKFNNHRLAEHVSFLLTGEEKCNLYVLFIAHFGDLKVEGEVCILALFHIKLELLVDGNEIGAVVLNSTVLGPIN